jgi:protein disulfide-isomerase
MKITFIAIAFFCATIVASAQDLVWETDVYKAISKSNEVKKPILMFFTGSDWCGWCIRLQNEVFKTPEFVEWANNNVVLVDLDFPRRTPQAENLKAQNNSLQQTFAVQGFPSIRIVNAAMKDATINFELLGALGYMAGGPKTWIDTANDVLKLNTKNYETVVVPDTKSKAKVKKPTQKDKVIKK